MQILAYTLSALAAVCLIFASLIKGEKMNKILMLVFLANVLAATGYIIEGSGINGAISCYIGGAQTIINYFYESKDKPIPKWLIGIYALAFISFNLYFGTNPGHTALVIIASLTFIMSIGQKNGARFRFWTLTNMILWCTYDVWSGAYNGLLTHIPILVFTVVGMIIHDVKHKK